MSHRNPAMEAPFVLWRAAAVTLLFALMTGVGALVRVPLLPVPVTLQVFFVLASGLVLGPVWGPASQVTYLTFGLLGAPFFAAPPHAGPAVLAGPTAGYLLGFVAASWVAGTLSGLTRDDADGGRPGLAVLMAAAVAGLFVLYVSGTAWLAAWLSASGGEAGLAFELGVKPFVAADIVKCAAAAIIVGSPLGLRFRPNL